MRTLFGSPARPAKTRPSTNSPSWALALAVSATLVLASCTDYKSRLKVPEDLKRTPVIGAVPPQPAEDERSVWGEEKLIGWVRLSFDVSETGEVGGVEVVESSDERLEAQAVESLSSWPFEPGTLDARPTPFEDVEFVMMFYTDDTTTTGEAIGMTLLVIVLVPVMVALALIGGGGEFKMGN